MLTGYWRAWRYLSRDDADVPRPSYFWVSGMAVLVILLVAYAWGLYVGEMFRGREPELSLAVSATLGHCALIFGSLAWMCATVAVARGDQLRRRDEKIRQLEQELGALKESSR